MARKSTVKELEKRLEDARDENMALRCFVRFITNGMHAWPASQHPQSIMPNSSGRGFSFLMGAKGVAAYLVHVDDDGIFTSWPWHAMGKTDREVIEKQLYQAYSEEWTEEGKKVEGKYLQSLLACLRAAREWAR